MAPAAVEEAWKLVRDTKNEHGISRAQNLNVARHELNLQDTYPLLDELCIAFNNIMYKFVRDVGVNGSIGQPFTAFAHGGYTVWVLFLRHIKKTQAQQWRAAQEG